MGGAREYSDEMEYISKENDQASRPISTARLSMLPRLHLPPINAVVSCGPSGTFKVREISS